LRRGQATEAEVIAAQKKTVAPVNEPPFQHKGTIRNLVEYASDRVRKNVVIGPRIFNSKSIPLGGSTGALILETGGRLLVFARRSKYPARIARRPYIKPNVPIAKRKFLQLMEQENL
jgi:hypothetical protein